MSFKGEWVVESRGETNILLFKSIDGKLRAPTADEAATACNILNEHGSYTVTLVCRNPNCKDKGGWIRRAVDDAKKNVYTCEVCREPMVR